MLLLNSVNHKNLLSYKIAFINGKELWVLFNIMEAGSMELILKSEFINGIKDHCMLATILKETLEGIEYLHNN
jgi:serine/threonine-protein kinase OSR1/STK39